MSRLDGRLATRHLPESHHVIGGAAGVAGPDTVHPGHFEGVNGEGLEPGDVVAGLLAGGGDHLVALPVRVLALQDVDDVVQHRAVVLVEGRRPGEYNAPGVKFHDQRLTRGAGHV